VEVDFGKLRSTKLGWSYRKCGDKVMAHSKVLNDEVTLCDVDQDRITGKTGGMTLSGRQGVKMARAKKCKFGKVKSGPRKGLCRKQRARRRAR